MLQSLLFDKGVGICLMKKQQYHCWMSLFDQPIQDDAQRYTGHMDDILHSRYRACQQFDSTVVEIKLTPSHLEIHPPREGDTCRWSTSIFRYGNNKKQEGGLKITIESICI